MEAAAEKTLRELECKGNRKEKNSEEQTCKQPLREQGCKESKKAKSSGEHGSLRKRNEGDFGDNREYTNMEVNGYYDYRRPNDNRIVEYGNTTLDNRSVVPYNRYLALRYGGHWNVEICAMIHD
ncbi:unnamed protein product [Haemonchus placei]|uniref:Uncharacterized protein n=1 Tax=Haemonchus placei TaxID=6290 RepID=A0A3P7XDG2_HAEPC|nr:unnamed protein product [Haemonchus placei]